MPYADFKGTGVSCTSVAVYGEMYKVAAGCQSFSFGPTDSDRTIVVKYSYESEVAWSKTDRFTNWFWRLMGQGSFTPDSQPTERNRLLISMRYLQPDGNLSSPRSFHLRDLPTNDFVPLGPYAAIATCTCTKLIDKGQGHINLLYGEPTEIFDFLRAWQRAPHN